MKSEPGPNQSNKLKQSDAFAIPDAVWPSESLVADILSSIVVEKPAPQPAPQPARVTTSSEAKTDYFKVIVSVATNAWRARAEILPQEIGGASESVKRLKQHIDAIYQNLADFGIAIRDHTGEPYDESLPLKVVGTKASEGADHKLISETVLPSIFWNERLIQRGEVKIATPAVPNAAAEPQISRP